MAGARGRSILDMGVMSIDAPAAVRLLKMCGVGRGRKPAGRGVRLRWSGPTAAAIEANGLDIFREIACALGADTKFADYARGGARRGFPVDRGRACAGFTRPWPGQGSRSRSSRGAVSSISARRASSSGAETLSGAGTGPPPAGDTVVSLNNSFRGRRAHRGGRVLGRGLPHRRAARSAGRERRRRIGHLRAVVPAAEGRDRRPRREGPRGTDRPVRAALRVDDVFHKSAEQGGRLAGLPLGRWLEAVGAAPGRYLAAGRPPADRQVWNGRFFPAVGRASGYREWLWMLAARARPRKPGSGNGARADRYSFAEMAVSRRPGRIPCAATTLTSAELIPAQPSNKM